MDNKPIAERDRIDLNHEISGSDVGRIQRFMSEDIRTLHGENSEKKKSERAMTMLMYLLENDAQYAKRYFEVADKLDKAQQDVDQALISVNQRLAVSDRELLKMEENSAKAEDGTSVFKSSDGSIYTRDGQRLSDEDAQKISIPEGAASWEEYKAEKEKRDALLRDKKAIEDYQKDVLQPAQDRMRDQDDPPTMDELDDIETQIETKMPAAVQKYANETATLNAPSAAQDIQGNAPLSVPDINTAFTSAANAIPAIPEITYQPQPAQTSTLNAAPV